MYSTSKCRRRCKCRHENYFKTCSTRLILEQSLVRSSFLIIFSGKLQWLGYLNSTWELSQFIISTQMKFVNYKCIFPCYYKIKFSVWKKERDKRKEMLSLKTERKKRRKKRIRERQEIRKERLNWRPNVNRKEKQQKEQGEILCMCF